MILTSPPHTKCIGIPGDHRETLTLATKPPGIFFVLETVYEIPGHDDGVGGGGGGEGGEGGLGGAGGGGGGFGGEGGGFGGDGGGCGGCGGRGGEGGPWQPETDGDASLSMAQPMQGVEGKPLKCIRMPLKSGCGVWLITSVTLSLLR